MVTLTNLQESYAFVAQARARLEELLFDDREEAAGDLAYELETQRVRHAKVMASVDFTPGRPFFDPFVGTYAHALFGKITVRLEGAGRGARDGRLQHVTRATAKRRRLGGAGRDVARARRLAHVRAPRRGRRRRAGARRWREEGPLRTRGALTTQTHGQDRGQVQAMLSGTNVKPPQLDEFFLREELPLREADLRELGLPLD
ncbi:MAG TPA: hypothetical protein VGM56_13630 [Byssovorax sp.]|jgi:hypothetical protein